MTVFLSRCIPILPRLIEQPQGGNLSAASHTFGLLAALYSLMQFVFAPIWGRLSDRIGRRPVLLAFWTSFLVRTYAWLFLLRPSDLGDARIVDALPDEYLFTLIKNGGATIGKPGMPAFGYHLKDEEIREVVRYLRTLPPR